MADIFPPISVLDDFQNAENMYLCNAEPTDFTEATSTYAVADGPITIKGAVEDRENSPDEKVQVPTTAVTATSNDTATHWALCDDSAGDILATGALASSLDVLTGDGAFVSTFKIPESALSDPNDMQEPTAEIFRTKPGHISPACCCDEDEIFECNTRCDAANFLPFRRLWLTGGHTAKTGLQSDYAIARNCQSGYVPTYTPCVASIDELAEGDYTLVLPDDERCFIDNGESALLTADTTTYSGCTAGIVWGGTAIDPANIDWIYGDTCWRIGHSRTQNSVASSLSGYYIPTCALDGTPRYEIGVRKNYTFGVVNPWSLGSYPFIWNFLIEGLEALTDWTWEFDYLASPLGSGYTGAIGIYETDGGYLEGGVTYEHGIQVVPFAPYYETAYVIFLNAKAMDVAELANDPGVSFYDPLASLSTAIPLNDAEVYITDS